MEAVETTEYDIEVFTCKKCNKMFELNEIFYSGTFNKDLRSKQIRIINFCPFCGEKLEEVLE